MVRAIRVLVERPARTRRKIKSVRQSQELALNACPRDHGAIVGAQRGRRRNQLEARAGGKARQTAPNGVVCGHTASHHKRGGITHLLAKDAQTSAATVLDHIDDGGLKRGAQIIHVGVAQGRYAFSRQPHRSLETR